MKITNHYRGILEELPEINKEKPEDANMTCNWFDLETLASQPIVPKKLPYPRLPTNTIVSI